MVDVVTRTWRSLRKHGLWYTLRRAKLHAATAMSRFRDRRFDSRYGTDTAAIVEVAEMSDVVSENLANGIRYEPTRAQPLMAILRSLNLPGDAALIDIGCGKGRAMIVALEAGITRVDGIDYSQNLCAIAMQNLQRYREVTGREFDCNIETCDATDAVITPEHTVLFMFNPFAATVMEKVLDRVDVSLGLAPRDFWLIYHHPLWRANIARRPRYECVLEKTVGGCEFVVYRTRRQGAGTASASTLTS